MQFTISAVATVILAASTASAHCKIPIAQGNAGGKSTSLGIIANSGNGFNDCPIMGATGFGTVFASETNPKAPINVNTAVPAALKVAGSKQFPQVTEGGQLFMTLHKVNADGAGPFACSINTDGTANSFKSVTVTKNVMGKNGISLQGNDTDFQLTARIPNNVKCTGKIAGTANLCLLKCENPVGFGGIIPMQIAGGANRAAVAGGRGGQRNGKNRNGAQRQNKNQNGNKAHHQRDEEEELVEVPEVAEIAGRAAGVRDILRRAL